MPESPNDGWKQFGGQHGVALGGEMHAVRLEIFSADAISHYRDDPYASTAKLRNDRRKLRLLVSLPQSPRIERAAYRAKRHNSGPVRNGLSKPT
jgi:hypothetical protein